MANSDFTDKLLVDLYNKYKFESAAATAYKKVGSVRNVELEIRFKDVSRETFESLYTSMMSGAKSSNPSFTGRQLECSINIISENIYETNTRGKVNDTQYIQKVLIEKGEATSKSFYEKSRIVRPVQVTDYINYSVGLSSETTSKEFRTSANALLRFKIRASFDFLDNNKQRKWRFDITAIKEGNLKNLGLMLKTIRTQMFSPILTIDNFLPNLAYDLIDKYEVEIEYIGVPADITTADISVVKKLFELINPAYIHEIAYQEEIYKIAEYITTDRNMLQMFHQSSYRLKQLANQAISLTKNTYYLDVFPPVDYFITEKTDGQRCIISINGDRCRIMLSATMIEIGTFVQSAANSVTIVDAELVMDKADPVQPHLVNGKANFSLHLFDCMVIRDEVITQVGFEERVTRLAEASIVVNKCFQTAVCVPKHFTKLTKDTLKDGIEKVWNDRKKYAYDIDGLIFTEPKESYSNTKNYKWKPYERVTIDFLAMKCPKLGVIPYIKREGLDLYLLFVGINHNMRDQLGLGFIPLYRNMFPSVDNASYYPIQFSPSSNPLAYLYYHDVNKYKGTPAENLDKQIIELGRNRDNTEWIFHLLRSDRKMEKTYFGNDFKTAELTYLNYIDPFDLENLWHESTAYFTKSAADIYVAANKFKRFIIGLMLKDNLSNVKWIIDEAAGRGADLHRYQKIGTENALFMDIDPTALAELIRRKFDFFAIKKKKIHQKYGRGVEDNTDAAVTTRVVTAYDRVHDIEYDKVIVKDVKSLTVHTLVADLKTPNVQLISMTYQFGLNPSSVDGIVCNFALHYMCDTMENIRNLLVFNAKMLRVEGIFMFTVMDGKRVFELLKENGIAQGQQWEVREGEILKYAIRRDYAGDTLSKSGQMISVLLPLNDQMMAEPLCNIDVVISEATKVGFSLELNESMDTYLDKFKHADRALYDRLTPDDIKYISLHSFVTLKKTKDVKKVLG